MQISPGKILEQAAVHFSPGAQAVKKTDWSPLRGRGVVVWPDINEAGFKYLAGIADILGQPVDMIDAEALARIDPRTGMERPAPPKFDAAYGLEEGWEPGALADAAIRHVKPIDAPAKADNNFAAIETAIEAAAKHEACAVFVRAVIDLDLDVAQTKLLAQTAGDRSGAGIKVAEKMLDDARAKRREAEAQAVRDKAAAESTRTRIGGIFPDDEISPVMKLLDGILCGVTRALYVDSRSPRREEYCPKSKPVALPEDRKKGLSFVRLGRSTTPPRPPLSRSRPWQSS
jgi:hypothetical protein